MKILVICQYYYPEPFRIADICEELVKRGHEITVVTGNPNYPMGEIYDGYQNGSRQDEIINGVKVHRCRIHPRKTGALNRFLNYYSYPYESVKFIETLPDDFDVVFINQLSPVMMAKAGIRYAKKHRIKSVLYCLDLWPESLIFGGISRSSLIYKYYHRVSKKIYKNVNKILITSKSFAEYFDRQFGINNVSYLPQYAESLFTPKECRKEPDEYIDLMFAGNVGTAQYGEILIKAADKCRDIANLRWHIVGDGVELEKLEKMAKDIDAPVTFYGRKPLQEMPKYYAMADAMLVTMQKDAVLSMTLPGKVQSYMAAGKPIIGAIDGETNTVLQESGCGFCCSAEDADGLAACVLRFVSADKALLGKNARAFYESHFTKQMFFAALEAELKLEKKESVYK